jgi:23S rRNA pseudouridine2605 synthase
MRRRGATSAPATGQGPRKPRFEGAKPAASRDAKPRVQKPRLQKPPTEPPPRTTAFEGERVAKVMARAGACSRRDAEHWITEGRVAVNGRVLTSPAVNVREGDAITIDGAPLGERERTRLFLFHKPVGLVTSAKDPEGRETVFAFLEQRHPDLPRVVSVGRLDINTEGLLLLTNDGGLARTLELPATGWTRRYRVRAHGEIDQARLDALKQGVTVDGVKYAPIDARLDRVQGANAWISMSLSEGKNREIKRVLEQLRLDVTRLIRVSYGPFQLGELAEGAVEEVKLKVLREQLGKELAAFAGVDFSSGLRDHAAPSATEAQDARERLQKRPRKHVSALRKQREEKTETGPRVRVERGATADRKGRAVSVEKRIASRPKAAADESRNSRHFRALRRADENAPPPSARERNQTRGRGEGRSPPRAGDKAPYEARGRGPDREARAPRQQRDARYGDKQRDARFPNKERDDRRAPPRERSAERSERPSREAFRGPRPPRDEGAARPRNFARDDRPRNFDRGAERSPRPPAGGKPRGPGVTGDAKRFDGPRPDGPRKPGGGGRPGGFGKPGGPGKPRGKR